jgi:hypothetical protein
MSFPDHFEPTITPRENYIRAVKHQDPEWIPMKSDAINFTPQVYPDNIARAFVIEAQPYNGPVGGPDIFGIPWKFIPVAGGSMVEPGTPFLTDISQWKEKVVFPDIDSWDWAKSAEENRGFLNTDKLRTTWIFSGMFERLISFMDFEAAAVALIDEDQQDDVKELFQALVDFYKKLLDTFVKYYDIDAVFFHDDWGSQRAAFFSLDTCREMLVPYMKQIVDHCHRLGLLFDFHCCGKNEALVPAMIECGMDMWGGQPINNKQKLVADHGKEILIGAHDPFFGPGRSIPEDDAELYGKVEEFFAPYAADLKEKPLFIMDLRPDARVIEACRNYSHKLLTR